MLDDCPMGTPKDGDRAMFQIRNSLMILFCLVSSFTFVATLNAAPMLLLELSHNFNGSESASPLPTAVPFDFRGGEPSQFPPNFSWRVEYGPSDVGIALIAPPDVLAGVNSTIGSPTARCLFETGPANFSSDRPFYRPGQIVTSVNRIVDQLMITPGQGDMYTLQAIQRIQIWGVPVPEPNTVRFILIGIVPCTVMMIRGRKN